jgi:diacylglycerol kinase family enzyme
VNPEVELGVIASGTGGDFIRTLGLPRDVAGAAERLAEGKTRAIDLAKVRYRREDGEEAVRYYINEAEIGMGAAVCQAVNRASKRWGGRISFTRAILVTMLRYPNQQVRLAVDRAPAEAVTINNVWLANGVYSGGGIRCAPRARPDDGLLDIVQVGAMSTWEKIAGLPKLRSGDFSGNPNIHYRTARHVEAESDSPVPVEVEGEPIGYLPATFDLLDERLSVLT